MRCSRRDFATWTMAATAMATTASARSRADITHTSPAIHQEIMLGARPERVYRTLTVAEEFDKVVQLSAATNSAMKSRLGTTPTGLDARPGGAFAFFGGYITGFNVELVPDTRLVQAWRAGSWSPGQFSIAHFVLEAKGDSTLLIFDHTGFPKAEAEHLASGWHDNYWRPMAKSFA
jgi:activator of HSP90 ATPase